MAASPSCSGTRGPDRLVRPAVLPLRHRRRNARRARGGLAATAVDQNNGDWGGAPLTAQLEAVSIRWLLDLFGPDRLGRRPHDRRHDGELRRARGRSPVVGASAGRGHRRTGFRRPAESPCSRPGMHPSDTKALAMLGLGRDGVEQLSADPAGRLDLAALETELRAIGGEPSIVIASAGEVNAGDFDPVDAMADLAHEHGAWLHVDGAFGLFAAVSRPRTAGIEKADSVIADGHKWLNVPYDCGFAFVRDRRCRAPRSR